MEGIRTESGYAHSGASTTRSVEAHSRKGEPSWLCVTWLILLSTGQTPILVDWTTMACRLILVLANYSIGTRLIMQDGGKAWDPSRLPGCGTGSLGSNIQVLLQQIVLSANCYGSLQFANGSSLGFGKLRVLLCRILLRLEILRQQLAIGLRLLNTLTSHRNWKPSPAETNSAKRILLRDLQRI